MIAWWEYLFLGLAFIVWPVLYVRSHSRLVRERKCSDIEQLANFLAHAAIGSCLLSIGLLFMPMVAAPCLVFSILLLLIAFVAGIVASFAPSGRDHRDR